MFKKVIWFIFVLVIVPSCSKKKESTTETTTNIASSVVSNLSAVSSSFAPTSLVDSSSASSLRESLRPQSEVCSDSDGFAICQSNLIREYLKIGKQMVDLLGLLAGSVGSSLGNLPDGASGSSADGKISYNKSSSSLWSILTRGTGNASLAYFSVNSNVYTLKFDQSVAESDASDIQVEATVTYTDANNWDVDVFFSNTSCDIADIGKPSKAQIRVGKANGIWTGKAMLYHPRWEAPGELLTCATAAGQHELTMFTDFVGNDTSTKAALYLLPAVLATQDGFPGNITSYDLADFCSPSGPFVGYCGGTGEPTAGFLSAYPNNFCTTGPNTDPTWGSNCESNSTISAASFGSSNLWLAPATLKSKVVSLPTAL